MKLSERPVKTSSHLHYNNADAGIVPALPQQDPDRISVTLTDDMMFHYTMSKCNLALKGLVASLLHVQISDIKQVHVANVVDYNEFGKEIILDTRTEFNDGEVMNIEMQTYRDAYYVPRSLIYLCRSFDRLGTSEDYGRLRRTFHVGIMDGINLFPEHPEFLSEFIFYNRKKCYTYSDLMKIQILSLDQTDLATQEDLSSGLVLWAKLFKLRKWSELEELSREMPDDPVVQEVIRTMNEVNADIKKRSLFEAQRKYREVNTTYRNALARAEAKLQEQQEMYDAKNRQVQEQLDAINRKIQEQQEKLDAKTKLMQEQQEKLDEKTKLMQEQQEKLDAKTKLMQEQQEEIAVLKAMLEQK